MSLIPVLEQFKPGRSIYLPGATGEVLALADALATDPDRMADVVVTEHGVARLRDLSFDERAYALIAIADPKFRDPLEAQ